MQMRCTAAIIDLDGTMVDTLGDFDVALNAALRDHGLSVIGRDGIEQYVGKGSEHLVRASLRHVGGDESLASPLLASYLKHYLAINGQHSKVYDGVYEALSQFQAQGLRLACVTNKPLGAARELLTAKDLLGFFELVVGGDSYPKRKPDPMPIVETCKRMNTAPASVLVIGDSINDAQAARAAGCPVVLVSYGYNHGQDVRQLARSGVVDAVVARLGLAVTT